MPTPLELAVQVHEKAAVAGVAVYDVRPDFAVVKVGDLIDLLDFAIADGRTCEDDGSSD